MKKWRKGSYTIESVFLIPVIVVLLLLLMTYDFFVHNKNWYLAAAYEAVLAGNGRLKEISDSAEKTAEEKAEERARQQVMPGSRPNIEVNSYPQGMRVQYSGQKFPLFSDQWFEYVIDVQAEKVRPVKYLQTFWVMGSSENGITENTEGGSG